MRPPNPRPKSVLRSLPARTRAVGPFLPLTVAVLALWVAVITLAAVTDSSTLTGVGAAGLAMAIGAVVLFYRQQARLQLLAETDAVTGLVNHRGFHEALNRDLGHARDGRLPLALVVLDLDDFKAVNDAFGHPFGDGVLRAVAVKLLGAIRAGDVAARTGGEEFALILPDTSAEAAHAIAERAREAVVTVRAQTIPISCSAGIATFPYDATDASGLWRLADGALYAAKRTGKDRTRRFDPARMPNTPDGTRRLEVGELLAVPGAIRAHVQPIVALASGRVVAYEALARFPGHPERPVPTWFADAHACGLGGELEAAAIQAALAHSSRPIDTLLALNVSPSGLTSAAVRATFPRDLSGLVIEITEHEFAFEDAALMAAVADLRRRGALIAIDDAGAGYSGLNQLMRVRPDVVKIDRALIAGIHEDPARVALVESFVRFATGIGAGVCAEGIESLDDLSAVSDLDVRWGQGYALAKPAEPWPRVSEVAAEICRATLSRALRAAPGGGDSTQPGDRGLETVSARLAGARSKADLRAVLSLIAAELHADQISLSQVHSERGMIETLAEMTDEADTSFELDDYPLTARVLREQVAVQVLVGDPESDPSEVELMLSMGRRSMLMVPVVAWGESVGLIEAYTGVERPWTRTQINRARIIAHQFASVIGASFRDRTAT